DNIKKYRNELITLLYTVNTFGRSMDSSNTDTVQIKAVTLQELIAANDLLYKRDKEFKTLVKIHTGIQANYSGKMDDLNQQKARLDSKEKDLDDLKAQLNRTREQKMATLQQEYKEILSKYELKDGENDTKSLKAKVKGLLEQLTKTIQELGSANTSVKTLSDRNADYAKQ